MESIWSRRRTFTQTTDAGRAAHFAQALQTARGTVLQPLLQPARAPANVKVTALHFQCIVLPSPQSAGPLRPTRQEQQQGRQCVQCTWTQSQCQGPASSGRDRPTSQGTGSMLRPRAFPCRIFHVVQSEGWTERPAGTIGGREGGNSRAEGAARHLARPRRKGETTVSACQPRGPKGRPEVLL